MNESTRAQAVREKQKDREIEIEIEIDTSFSLYIGICTTTWGKFELPDSKSSRRGSHLYRFSGFFQKSFTRMITTPMYNLSMNSISDMVKHIHTATLNRGTINGCFTSSQINPICPATSSLPPCNAPWNVSGRNVFAEISAISISLSHNPKPNRGWFQISFRFSPGFTKQCGRTCPPNHPSKTQTLMQDNTIPTSQISLSPLLTL